MTLRTVNNTLFNQFPSTITSFLSLVFLLITTTIFLYNPYYLKLH